MLSPTLCYIHPLLEIPTEVQEKAFPDASLSVLDFLQFPLPVISASALKQNSSNFFSNNPSTIHDIKTIQKIPIPPAKTINDLVVACKAALLSGTRSVKCCHTPSASQQNLPVWVIPYWAEILALHTTSQKAWMRAEEFIRL